MNTQEQPTAEIHEKPLTIKQAKVLHIITAFTKQVGFAPTHNEVGKCLKISKVTAFLHIQMLIKKGYVTRNKQHARTTIPTSKGWKWYDERGYCPAINLIWPQQATHKTQSKT